MASAVALSLTGVLYLASGASPSTASAYRCLLVIPVLWWLTAREERVVGARSWAQRRWALLAGVFFAVDLVLFHHGIGLMGAGLATVMSNLQVVIVLVVTWLALGERPANAQLVAGLMVAIALPRLPSVTTSLLLLVQPILSVTWAMLLVGERPSPAQLAGVGCVLAGVTLGSLPVDRMARRVRQYDEGLMKTSYRDLTCADARPEHVGRTVSLSGWVHRRRDLGQLIFIDLRDRYGITQVVVDAEESPEAHAVASGVRTEYVLQVTGRIAERLEGTHNAKLPTGDMELRASAIRILSVAKVTPFVINDPDAQIDEAVRLHYRYLDLRRESLQKRILARGRLVQAIREVHHAAGFVEVETPLLIKSTPEGARDFVVPSRLQPGNVYALPQSPQQLKQLLMVAGMDRYFQIARCFRDEDLRGDRQPEFTQLDLEMSFVAEQDVMAWVEEMAIAVTRAVTPERPIQETPFPRLTWRQAIDRYGIDKPDLRYGVEIHDLAEAVAGSGFGVFEETLAAGGRVVGIAAPGMAHATRKEIDELTDVARKNGARGLVWISLPAEDGAEVRGSIVKIVGADTARAIAEAAGATPGDLALIVADRDIHAQEALGKVRIEVAARLGLGDPNVLAYVWVHQFPMYQWDEDNGRWDATHNPFSGVLPEDEGLLVTTSGDPFQPSPDDPAGHARAQQYDLALNGWELGGGSVRFHTREKLSKSFALMGHSAEQQEAKFSGILEAFEYGAPPHGGIALGVDRWIALLTDQGNIREVMAFPKTSSGSDLMLDAPSPVEPAQLTELGLALLPPKPKA